MSEKKEEKKETTKGKESAAAVSVPAAAPIVAARAPVPVVPVAKKDPAPAADPPTKPVVRAQVPIITDVVVLSHPECAALAARLEPTFTTRKYVVRLCDEAELQKAASEKSSGGDLEALLRQAQCVVWILTSNGFQYTGCIHAVRSVGNRRHELDRADRMRITCFWLRVPLSCTLSHACRC